MCPALLFCFKKRGGVGDKSKKWGKSAKNSVFLLKKGAEWSKMEATMIMRKIPCSQAHTRTQ